MAQNIILMHGGEGKKNEMLRHNWHQNKYLGVVDNLQHVLVVVDHSQNRLIMTKSPSKSCFQKWAATPKTG